MKKMTILFFVLVNLITYGQGILNPAIRDHEVLPTLISDNFDTGSSSNWTNVGSASMTFGATGLIIGTGVTDYLKWIEYDPLPNTYEDFTVFMQIEVLSTGIFATSVQTQRVVTGSHKKTFIGSFIGGATTGRVVIATYADGTSTTVTNVADAGAGNIAYQVGDILNYSFRRSNINDYFCTVFNTRTGLQTTIAYQDIPDASPSVVAANNACKFAIHSVSGSFRIVPGTYSVTSNSHRAIRALFVGDSRTTFMSASPPTNRYANRVFANSSRRFQVDAGAYDITGVYSTQQACIDSYRADFVFLAIGRNDIFYGISSGTYQANYTAIRDNAVAGGSRVVHLLFPSDASATMTTFNSWVSSTFTSDIIIDMSGETLTYSDGVHFDNAGHQDIADFINSAMPYLTQGGY